MVFTRITTRPNVCTGKPCIRDLRFPVSRLLGLLASGQQREDILRAYPSLLATDLVVAWEYAATHPEEIEQAIRRNEAGDEGFAE